MSDQPMIYDMIFGRFSTCVSVIRADADLTICYANPAFYRMLGYTEEELQCRYASRLSAMLDVKTSKKLQYLIAGRYGTTSINFEHTIKGSQAEQWFLSEANCMPLEETGCIYLISQNIDRYKLIESTLVNVQKQDTYVYDNADYDYLEYDWKTGAVRDVKSRWFALGKIQRGEHFLAQIIKADLIHSEHEEKFFHYISELQKDDSRILVELRIKAPNGQYKWARLSLGCLAYDRRVSGICIFTDISAEKEAMKKYLEETFFYQSVLSDQEAFAHVDVTKNRLLRVGGLWDFFQEKMEVVPFDELFMEYKDKVVHPEDRARYIEVLNCDMLLKSFHNGIIHLACEYRRIIDQNKMVWMAITVHLFSNPLNQHVMALAYTKNIDEQKKQRLALEHESGRDGLTQIYNRRTAVTYIKEHLVDMEIKEICCLFLFDIDDFKALNDLYGHKAGDDILIKISHLIRGAFRKRDILGRYGGDEFIVFLKDVESLDNLRKRLNELLSYIETQLDVEVTGNIGITLVHKGDIYEDIYQKAEDALYQAKDLGKSRYVFYQNAGDIEIAIDGMEEVFKAGELQWKPTPEADEEIYGIRPANSIDALVGQFGDMAYLVDPRTYELLCGNSAFYNRMGKSEQECTSMKCYELMYNRTSPCPFCRRANWNTSRFYMYRNYNEVLEQDFLMKNKLVNWNHGLVLLAIAVDLSNDKNLSISIDNNSAESGSILSGIQHMQNAVDLESVMYNAMEAIGSFFRADGVRFWQYEDKENQYINVYNWFSQGKDKNMTELNSVDEAMVQQWLRGRKWTDVFYAESQEVMLCNSYDMHEWMKKCNIVNQHWVVIKDQGDTIGLFEIDNISTNFRNTSFLDTFLRFVESEWHKRILLDDILYINYHDGLTGALNRASYENFNFKYQADTFSSMSAVIVNINGLKNINGKLGIEYGNACLKSLAEIMILVYGQSQVYRLDGDEFLALLPNVSQVHVEERLRVMEECILNEGRYTVAFGYAWDDIEKDLNNMVEFATSAMRLNKRRRLESEAMDHIDSSDILVDILTAVDGKKMEIYLQPKMDTRIRKMVGAEALVRMHHDEYGIIPPAKFIDVLEKNNLIRYVDLFVFEEVCRVLQRWLEEGRECPSISVNFSRFTLMERDLVRTIDKIFNQYRIPKQKIEIEITESFEEGGKALLYQAAQKLFRAGYAISLDDFGTKYTNLSILTDIDVNILKLDKSLIYSIVENTKNQIILRNVIAMCEELGVEVIAEGVETKEQEDMLHQMGCYMIQGYLYSKPIPVKDFEEKFM